MSDKLTVDGLELYPTQMGADYRATFSWQYCNDGYEIIMHFRGIRRFALCTHKNDAEVIVEALNERKRKLTIDDWKSSFWYYAMWVYFIWGLLSLAFLGWIFWGIFHD